MNKQVKRKFLAAKGDLVEKIKEIAKKKNLTIFSLANEALENLIKAEQTGESLSQIIEKYDMIKAVREAGFTLTPENIWFSFLNQKVESKSNLTEFWKESGEWFGKYCKTKFTDDSSLQTLEKIMNIVLWDFSDFSIAKNESEITIRCVGSRTPENYTNLIAVFIQGVLEAYNYTITTKEVARGIIVLTFREKEAA